jgi:hypothetical protein
MFIAFNGKTPVQKKTFQSLSGARFCSGIQKASTDLKLPICANCFDRAGPQRFATQLFVAWRGGLRPDVRIPRVSNMFSLENVRNGLAAKVAVDAIIQYVELTQSIFRNLAG